MLPLLEIHTLPERVRKRDFKPTKPEINPPSERSVKGLVLNGSARGCRTAEMVERLLAEELRRRGWEVTTLPLRDLAIAPCTGCFG